MKFFADTADVAAIKNLNAFGILDGVTTNPSLIAKSGRHILEVTAEICSFVKGDVSAEVAATEFEGMMAEGKHLSGLASNVVVKLPLTLDGLRACRAFSEMGIRTNVTLCFSLAQAILAAKAGATYVSPFVGRLDDINLDGIQLIEDIRLAYDNYGFETQILAASLRNTNHISQVALAGADVATCPPDVILKMAAHPLTESGLAQFVADWKATGQSIL